MMRKCYSTMDKQKIEYCWIIKNFTNYFNLVDNTSLTISSKTFEVDVEHEKRSFCLQMIFSSQSISCSLQNCPAINLECQLSILNKHDERFKTVNLKIDNNNRNSTVNLPQLIVKLNDLLSNALDLFPDNNLKVQCDFTIFKDDAIMSPIYIPKHHQSMKDNFEELLNSQSGSDVIFKVDGQEFKAHQLILMARSPVFSAMFTNDMIEKNSNLVKIVDIPSSIFELMIHFIYTDEINTKLDLETGIDLLKAASKYQLEGLEALCEAELFNLLTIDNVMVTLIMAEKYNFTNFVESIKNFIRVHRKEIKRIVDPQYFFNHPHHTILFLTCEDEGVELPVSM